MRNAARAWAWQSQVAVIKHAVDKTLHLSASWAQEIDAILSFCLCVTPGHAEESRHTLYPRKASALIRGAFRSINVRSSPFRVADDVR